jgi:siroheme synthase (precorrin-2 oxidase/ferrochelatase)
MVAYYPICLNITNKRCVIAGGGEVGARRAKGLVVCNARVVVLGRQLSPRQRRRFGGVKDCLRDAGALELELT